MLEELQEPLIWIDADCNMREMPVEFDDIENQFDMGLVFREDNSGPHSGIIYFKYNKNTINFLKKMDC